MLLPVLPEVETAVAHALLGIISQSLPPRGASGDFLSSFILAAFNLPCVKIKASDWEPHFLFWAWAVSGGQSPGLATCCGSLIHWGDASPPALLGPGWGG